MDSLLTRSLQCFYFPLDEDFLLGVGRPRKRKKFLRNHETDTKHNFMTFVFLSVSISLSQAFSLSLAFSLTGSFSLSHFFSFSRSHIFSFSHSLFPHFAFSFLSPFSLCLSLCVTLLLKFYLLPSFMFLSNSSFFSLTNILDRRFFFL